jgi:hypothetical protein
MAMRFTATVKKHEVVIRDVPYQDGEVVEVTIEREGGLYEPTLEEWREIELGEAEAAAGLGRPLDEFLAELRANEALRGASPAARRTRRGARDKKVGISGS